MALLSLLLSALLLSIADVWIIMPQAISDAVLDTDGQMLQTEAQYYVLPGVHGQGGGGLILGSLNGQCPMYVAQHESNASSGIPVSFSPVNNTGLAVIQVSMDVKFLFHIYTICIDSAAALGLGNMDRPMGRRRFVRQGGGGVWFEIERYGYYYKLVDCQSHCMGCKGICRDVGVVKEGGKRWLVWSEEPLPVVFKKVENI